MNHARLYRHLLPLAVLCLVFGIGCATRENELKHERNVAQYHARRAETQDGALQKLIDDLNNALDMTKSELADANTKQAATDTQLKTTETTLASTNTQLATTNAQLKTTEATLASTNTQLATTDGQLKATAADLKSSQAQQAATSDELKATKNDLAKSQADLAAAAKAADAARIATAAKEADSQKQIAALNASATDLQTQIATLTAAHNAVKADLEKTKQELAAANDAAAKLKAADEATAQAKEADYQKKLAAANGTSADLQTQVATLTGAGKAMKADLEKARQDLAAANDAGVKLKAAADATAQTRDADSQKKSAELNASILALQKTVTELTKANEALKADLAKAKSGTATNQDPPN